jgi:hypothetical protein
MGAQSAVLKARSALETEFLKILFSLLLLQPHLLMQHVNYGKGVGRCSNANTPLSTLTSIVGYHPCAGGKSARSATSIARNDGDHPFEVACAKMSRCVPVGRSFHCAITAAPRHCLLFFLHEDGKPIRCVGLCPKGAPFIVPSGERAAERIANRRRVGALM